VYLLGGVTMCIDQQTTSIHTGATYHPGCQHLRPWQALDYVRQREDLPGGDYDRQRHQQQFIKALLQQAYAKGISDPLKISSFLKSLGKAFQFDGGGHNTSDWIFTLKGISPGAIRTIKINNGTYNTVMVGKMSTQQMSADSLQLLSDVRTDTVDNFLAVHPDWVTTS
jgi:anionic cell wall polymer biosynthesis LytR-Cps2A-Psr (LCP) family protein